MNAANKFFERMGIAFVVVLCVFSSWIFITQGLDFDPDGPGLENEGKVSCEIYYFSNLVNSDPTEVGNYSCDEKFEGGVTELPDFSVNEVHVASEAVFEGDITFNGAAVNSGTVNGNANFVGDISENSGTVTGTLTRTYNASISTSRNFTQNNEVWTIVATNGATVDVTDATYNNDTIFSTEDGGSFIYPEEVADNGGVAPLGAGRFSGIESDTKKNISEPASQSLSYDLNATPIVSKYDSKNGNEEEKIIEPQSTGRVTEISDNSKQASETEAPKSIRPVTPIVEQKTPVTSSEVSGQLKSKLLLAVEDKGKVWYVAPNDTVRYEVSPTNSLNLFRKVSLGITNKDLSQIPVAGSSDVVTPLSQRLVGRFLLQVESRGETWYVDQLGYKHRVTSQNLLEVTSKAVLGIDNEKLEQIPVANTAQ